MKCCAVIPARYKSSRLPGKPLLEINGKPIIQRVYEQVIKSTWIDKVYVTTDDDRIINVVESIGGHCIKVTVDCLNGTERICHALPEIDNKYDIIVNVQGDEPFIDPLHLDLCIEKMQEHLDNSQVVCTTLHYPLDLADVPNPSLGKMVMDLQNNVMYASRTPIPTTKRGAVNPQVQYYGHIGIFVFKRELLEGYLALENTPAQLSEDIEWLKIMEHGMTIKSYFVEEFEIGVNTMEDYQYLLKKYSKSSMK